MPLLAIKFCLWEILNYISAGILFQGMDYRWNWWVETVECLKCIVQLGLAPNGVLSSNYLAPLVPNGIAKGEKLDSDTEL